MGAYLVDNQPATPQWRYPRREEPSGGIVVHVTAPGNGQWVRLQTLLDFELSRTTPGSYHDAVSPLDKPGFVDLIPYTYEAFQATDGSNRYAYSLGFCCDPETWDVDDQNTKRALDIGGERIAKYARWWANLKPGRDPRDCCRLISPEQFHDRLPGMVEHRQIQQGRYDSFGLAVGGPRPDADELRIRLRDAALFRLTPDEETMTPELEARFAAQDKAIDSLTSKVDRVLNHLNGKDSTNPSDERPLRDPIGETRRDVAEILELVKP